MDIVLTIELSCEDGYDDDTTLSRVTDEIVERIEGEPIVVTTYDRVGHPVELPVVPSVTVE